MSAEDTLSGRMNFLGLNAEARASLLSIKPILDTALGLAQDEYYKKAVHVPELSRFFPDEAQQKASKARMARHYGLLLTGEWKKEYVLAAQRIGQLYAQAGFEPRWYVGSIGIHLCSLVESVVNGLRPSWFQRSKGHTKAMAGSVTALIKAYLLDLDLSISTYIETLETERQRANAARVERERQAVHAIEAMAKSLACLAEGNLVARMGGELADEFAQLKADFNLAVDKLQETMTSVSRATDGINAGAEEIAQASDDLSRRTEQQAASLEQIAATLEQLTISVRDTAKGAERAAASVANAKTDAQQSDAVVKQTVAAMSEIESSSQQIATIISVIDEIAFQTNLLALNAGVEAARAGDAGRGFAVVAQEVRALAQRSATAAKEIKALIAESSAKVATGVGLVHKSSGLLQQIISRVVEIDALVGGIATAAKQQATGLGEVNIAVGQMDQITQSNAAMVEEATAAAHSLRNESSELTDLVGQFKTRSVKTLGFYAALSKGGVG